MTTLGQDWRGHLIDAGATPQACDALAALEVTATAGGGIKLSRRDRLAFEVEISPGGHIQYGFVTGEV
jgi:hypothetical protein